MSNTITLTLRAAVIAALALVGRANVEIGLAIVKSGEAGEIVRLPMR